MSGTRALRRTSAETRTLCSTSWTPSTTRAWPLDAMSKLTLDVAASGFYDGKRGSIGSAERADLSSEGFVAYLADLAGRFPIAALRMVWMRMTGTVGLR